MVENLNSKIKDKHPGKALEQSEHSTDQSTTDGTVVGLVRGAYNAVASIWFFNQIGKLRQEGLRGRVIAFIKKAIRKINHELLLRPTLRSKLMGLSKKLGLFALLKKLHLKAHNQNLSLNSSQSQKLILAKHLENLSPQAQKIYDELRMAIENNKGGV